ncbi:MAG: hypothetical protein RLZZ511_45 [Cyanobacteriota bacterium]|jgi:uncharacterized protein YjbI with pentapeptide repeats
MGSDRLTFTLLYLPMPNRKLMALQSSLAAVPLVMGLATGAIAQSSPTQQLLATKQCASCNLSGAGLVLAKLPGADLRSANLVGANLSQADLTGANLAGANLVGAGLSGANLAGANLRGANLSGVDLRDAYLVGADLTDAKLDNAYYQTAIGLPKTVGTADEFYRLAVMNGQQRQYEQAVNNFTQALDRQPDYAAAWLGRGVALYQSGNLKAAIADVERAIAIYERNGDKVNLESARKMVAEMRKPVNDPAAKGGGLGNVGQALLGVGGLLLKLFVGI